MSTPAITFTVTGIDAVASIVPVASFVSKKPDSPELGCVCLTMKSDELFIVAINGGQSFAKSIKLQMQTVPDFKLCMDATKLRAIISSLKEAESLKFTIDADGAVISAGRSKLKCPTLSADGFPSPPKVTEQTFSMVIESANFLHLLKRTKHAIAIGDTRYYLNGLNLVCKDGTITANASDGHRLSTCSVGDLKFQGEVNVIIPKTMVDLLAAEKQLEAPNSKIKVSMDSKMIEVIWASGMLRSQLIDGRFPDITRFVSGQFQKKVEADKQNFFASLNRVRGVVQDSKNQMLRMENVDGELRVYATDSNRELLGEDYVTGAVCHDGFATSLSMNVNYLADALAAFAADDVELGSGVNDSLVLFSKSNPLKVEVVMPMRD